MIEKSHQTYHTIFTPDSSRNNKVLTSVGLVHMEHNSNRLRNRYNIQLEKFESDIQNMEHTLSTLPVPAYAHESKVTRQYLEIFSLKVLATSMVASAASWNRNLLSGDIKTVEGK